MAKITFHCDTPFGFEAGQFVSILIPTQDGSLVKRLYSLANSHEHAQKNGYELCIKKVAGGLGSNYLAALQPGDTFQFLAPYGHFHFMAHRKRPVVFIGTGSGIAPLRSIALSKTFQDAEVPFSMGIFGFKTSAEVPYLGEFESAGIATRYAISREDPQHPSIRKDRVTGILRKLKRDFPWSECDFYICGNQDMIAEVREILQQKWVPETAIFYESFSVPEIQQNQDDEKKAA